MSVKSWGATAAAIVIAGTAVFADPQGNSGGRRIAPAENVTVVGCVHKEADWRRANRFFNPLGVGDEYILTDASMAAAAAATSGATGTAGAVMTYELSGQNEKKLGTFVGKRVEMAGTLKEQEVGSDGKPTGGPSAGVTADLKLREMEVTSVKEVSGTCSPLK